MPMVVASGPEQGSNAKQAGAPLKFDEPDHHGHFRYRVLESLGRGSFGEVFKAVDRLSGREVAMKRIFLRQPELGIPSNVLREYKALQILQDDNIVELLDVFAMGPHLVTVMELCCTDLHSVLYSNDFPLLPSVIKRLLSDLLKGVHAMHSNGIIHRDLKPSNIMLMPNGRLKITDLGLCRVMQVPGRAYSFTQPSLSYRAPELLFNCKLYDGQAVDMWAVGCIFAELMRNVPLFRADCELAQVSTIINILGSYHPELWGGSEMLPDYGKIYLSNSDGIPLPELFPDATEAALESLPSQVAAALHVVFNEYSTTLCHSSVTTLSDSLHLLTNNAIRYDPSKRPSAAEALAMTYFYQEPRPADDQTMADFVQMYQCT